MNQVAVLDVGSSKITAVVGEKGINKTFIVKARKDFAYDGYMEGSFLDNENVKSVIIAATEFLVNSFGTFLDKIYVGVPGDFLNVYVKDSQISFAKKKKITEEDIDLLFDSAFVLPSQKHSLINRSAIVYELNDYRRLANPVGEVSELLKGKLSFALCSNYFIELFKSSISVVGGMDVEFISVPLAEAMYLLSSESRDRIAIIVDVGYISTTFALIQGDGILYQNSFDYGGGFITAAITKKLEIDFETAELLKRKINLCRTEGGSKDLVEDNDGRLYNAELIRDTILANLDDLCENISDSMEKTGYVIPEYVPVLVTGGGISYLRGAIERVSNRLCSTVSVVAPRIPMMDKPTDSSLFSLLDLIFG